MEIQAAVLPNIYVGLLTVTNHIAREGGQHSPVKLADLYWKMYNERSDVEIQR